MNRQFLGIAKSSLSGKSGNYALDISVHPPDTAGNKHCGHIGPAGSKGACYV